MIFRLILLCVPSLPVHKEVTKNILIGSGQDDHKTTLYFLIRDFSLFMWAKQNRPKPTSIGAKMHQSWIWAHSDQNFFIYFRSSWLTLQPLGKLFYFHLSDSETGFSSVFSDVAMKNGRDDPFLRRSEAF